MVRQSQQIDTQRFDIELDLDLASRLGGIGVERYPCGFDEAGDFGNRLDRSDFVVGVHDRYQASIGSHSCGHGIRVDATVPRQPELPQSLIMSRLLCVS